MLLANWTTVQVHLRGQLLICRLTVHVGTMSHFSGYRVNQDLSARIRFLRYSFHKDFNL